MLNKMFSALLPFIFGVFTVVAVQTFAHACGQHDGVWGACHYSQQAVTGLGVAIAVLGLINFFVSGRTRAQLSLSIAVNALLMIAFPTFIIGVCKGASMHCRQVMLPTVIVVAVLTLIFSIAAAVLDLKVPSQVAKQ